MFSSATELGISVTGFGTAEFRSEVAGRGPLKSSRLCTGRPSNFEINVHFETPYAYRWATPTVVSFSTEAN